MKSINYPGLLGSLLIIAGWMSPMLKVPLVKYWNYWDLDTSLATVVMVLAILGIIAAIVNKHGLLRFSGWAVLAVVLLTLVGVYFKIHDTFSFIPFKKLAKVAMGLVHYRWAGWVLLFIGSALMIFSGRKKTRINETN